MLMLPDNIATHPLIKDFLDPSNPDLKPNPGLEDISNYLAIKAIVYGVLDDEFKQTAEIYYKTQRHLEILTKVFTEEDLLNLLRTPKSIVSTMDYQFNQNLITTPKKILPDILINPEPKTPELRFIYRTLNTINFYQLFLKDLDNIHRYIRLEESLSHIIQGHSASITLYWLQNPESNIDHKSHTRENEWLDYINR